MIRDNLVGDIWMVVWFSFGYILCKALEPSWVAVIITPPTLLVLMLVINKFAKRGKSE